MNYLRIVLSAAGLVVALTGCQAYWNAEPDFGSSVNGAIQAQVQNPNAPKGYPKALVGMDGPAAKTSVETYQKSFERKQPQTQTTTGTMVGSSLGLTVQ
jgi:hypothetical protein